MVNVVIQNSIGIIIINALNVLFVPGNQHALRVAPGQILPGNLTRKEELTFLESESWLRKRKHRGEPCLIHQTKKKLMGTLPHMALLSGGRHIKVATPRILVPRGV